MPICVGCAKWCFDISTNIISTKSFVPPVAHKIAHHISQLGFLFKSKLDSDNNYEDISFIMSYIMNADNICSSFSAFLNEQAWAFPFYLSRPRVLSICFPLVSVETGCVLWCFMAFVSFCLCLFCNYRETVIFYWLMIRSVFLWWSNYMFKV